MILDNTEYSQLIIITSPKKKKNVVGKCIDDVVNLIITVLGIMSACAGEQSTTHDQDVC